LPEHSWLRSELPRSIRADGKLLPYMDHMKVQGIRRAYVQVASVWRKGIPDNVRVVRIVYFDEYDGPHFTGRRFRHGWGVLA